MVLDEEALEAMLRRQNGAAEADEEPMQSQLTDQTEEFEVYERPRTEPDGPAPEPSQAPTPAGPDFVRDDEQFEELPGRSEPGPAQSHTPQEDVVEPQSPPPAAPQHPPEPTPQQPATQQSATAARSEPVQESVQEEEAPRRPRVWPPIQETQRTHAPTQVQEPAPAHTPDQAPVPESTQATPAASEQAGAPPGGPGCNLAIVQATFNSEVTDIMADIARKQAGKLGCTVTHETQVAGVYDLPLTAQTLARRDDVDAVIVLGCVVQGETQHDLVITQATATTLQRVALETGKPVGFGVTGPGMTWQQAEARVVNAKHAVEAAVAQWRALRTV